MSEPTIAVQPVVNWPRRAQGGQRYVVVADLMLTEPAEWPYQREEFVIGCVLEGGSAFSIEALGSTSLVLHRFGGTYGPVRFLVRAERDPSPAGTDPLRLTFLTEGGVPFRTVHLDVRPMDGSPEAVEWPRMPVEIVSASDRVPSRDHQPPNSAMRAPAPVPILDEATTGGIGRSVLRILGPDGLPAGTGLLVSNGEVLTCTHVVNAALRRDPFARDFPTGSVTVRSPYVDGTEERTARVVCWRPPPHADQPDDGIAGLRLDQPLTGARPVELASDPPSVGTVVRAFGHPPQTFAGQGFLTSMVIVGRTAGRILLSPGAAIPSGFSGAPVYEEGTGRVVGLLTTTSTGPDSREVSAVDVITLRNAWAAVLGPQETVHDRRASLTFLHVSDPQFSRHVLFGGNGLTPADRAHDPLFARLHDDLAGLASEHDLRPDLMVVTGDLTESGLRTEFERVVDFLTGLAEAVGLPRHRVAIVPGNHDVNRKACEAYFDAAESDEREPVPPYFPKWKHFVAAFEEFYAGVAGVTFTPDEPWTLFEMPDLAVVVAGLNSTMAESHRAEDHYGWVGERQLRWFAERLASYRDRGWLRLAAVHHNVIRGAAQDDENLRDADDLDRILGRPGLVNLLLHGHTHDGRLRRLPSGLVALSTGSAAVAAAARPAEVPNQYQLITVGQDGVTRHARQYGVGQRRWIGDTRISPTGSDWRDRVEIRLTDVDAALPPADSDRPTHRAPAPSIPVKDLFAQVAEATAVRFPGATLTLRPERGYLRVAHPLPGGEGVELWPVGVVDGPATADALSAFIRQIHAQFTAASPNVRSELVYAGPPAPEELESEARGRGIRLRSLVDYQGLLDLRPLVTQQTERLANDPVYPAYLYMPQRYRLIEGDRVGEAQDGLLERVVDWLGEPDARLILVLGDFGRGKTSLLHQLARILPEALPGLLPTLVELRSLEKAPSLDELLAQHLIRQQVEAIDPARLRYMIRSGRLALLLDGLDELELRVGYDNSADYLRTLLESVTDHAKVVLTSRTQHFLSTVQVRTALGERVSALTGSRIVVLEDFTTEQILRFLTNLYAGDAAARARLALIGEIEGLLGLARNPRMLAFIAELDEDQLRAIQHREGRISAAELYRELIEFWLVGEADRQHHRHGIPSLGQRERLAACTALAKRLWMTSQTTISTAELTAEVSAALVRLAERGYSIEQAAHTIGSGSLLVRTGDASFTFMHQSVMEWLVANAAARSIVHGEQSDELGAWQMPPLMVDFFCDLAGPEKARAWSTRVLRERDSSTAAIRNATAVIKRLGGPVAGGAWALFHGVGQQHMGPNQLRALWQPALQYGLEHAAGRSVSLPNLEMVFYGDLFRPVFLDVSVAARSSEELVHEIVEDLETIDNDEAASLAEGIPVMAADLGETSAKRLRVPRILRAAIAALDRVNKKGAGLLYFGELRQILRYLRSPDIKAAIDQRVDDTVPADCTVLIAHSLGSIVAFEYVQRHPHLRFELLLTFGSPLGLRSVYQSLPDPSFGVDRGIPANVSTWVNLRDVGDPVAAGSLRARWSLVQEVTIDNGAEVHAAQRYLGTTAAGAALLAAMHPSSDD
jgi:3',5'-cyclic AMP phosphodiesterase CpdA